MSVETCTSKASDKVEKVQNCQNGPCDFRQKSTQAGRMHFCLRWFWNGVVNTFSTHVLFRESHGKTCNEYLFLSEGFKSNCI